MHTHQAKDEIFGAVLITCAMGPDDAHTHQAKDEIFGAGVRGCESSGLYGWFKTSASVEESCMAPHFRDLEIARGHSTQMQ